jgi:hypothetical protein
MIEEVTITLPKYAVRYLREMCNRDREFLACVVDKRGYTIGCEAAYDSLDAIECALPDEPQEHLANAGSPQVDMSHTKTK